MARQRLYGEEQPGISLGPFKLRLPFVHYRFEMSEALQGIFMCATCLGAIPVLQEVLGVSFEVAWGMVIINGFLYFLHATLGDPVVPGWITPAIPLTIAFLNGYEMGPQRIQALIALQLMVGLIFIILGATGLAKRIIQIVPRSIQAGILLGAGVAALIGEFNPAGRFHIFPITIAASSLLAFFLLFSRFFKDLRKKNKICDFIGGLGMLPAIILAVIVGPLVGEMAAPQIEWGFFFIPPMGEIIRTVSPFGIGFPSLQMFAGAIPMALMAYIIAFGDFVTGGALIQDADEARPDEKIDFDPNRSNLVSGLRNVIMALISPFTQLCGPLWAAVTAAVSQRYKDGPKAMNSIFSGVGTFRLMTAFYVALIPIATLLRPALPVALSATLLVQGFICTGLAMRMCKTNQEQCIAGVMGGVLAVMGAAWGLAIGVILHILIDVSFVKKEDEPQTPKVEEKVSSEQKEVST